MSEERIVIVNGDDTDWNGQDFLTLRLTTTILDLSEYTAEVTLAGIKKTFSDISSGEIVLNYSSEETASLPCGKIDGVLRLFKDKKQATIESRLPFLIINSVHGNSIATEPFEMTINVEQGGENILNIDIEAGVSVEVGTTTTLPAGSSATVTNSGTGNHLVLDFGIPQGIQGEQGEQGVQGPPGENATIIIRRL